jgi:hypothetical protein
VLKSGCLVWPAEIHKAGRGDPLESTGLVWSSEILWVTEAGNAEIQWLGFVRIGSEISICPRYVVVNQALDCTVCWCGLDVIVRTRDLNVVHAVRSKTKSPYVEV